MFFLSLQSVCGVIPPGHVSASTIQDHTNFFFLIPSLQNLKYRQTVCTTVTPPGANDTGFIIYTTGRQGFYCFTTFTRLISVELQDIIVALLSQEGTAWKASGVLQEAGRFWQCLRAFCSYLVYSLVTSYVKAIVFCLSPTFHTSSAKGRSSRLMKLIECAIHTKNRLSLGETGNSLASAPIPSLSVAPRITHVRTRHTSQSFFFFKLQQKLI